jgi:CHASE1-domain containing sensor protein/tRNA A-37 threonylcarbamoyl transferase component Bud32
MSKPLQSVRPLLASRGVWRSLSLYAWPSLRGVWLGLLLITVGVSVSAWRASVSGDEVRHDTARRFRERVSALQLHIVRGLLSPLEVQESLRTLLSIQPDLSADSFQRFVSPALARYPAITAVEWAPYVLDADRAAFEAQMRGQGLRGYRITEPSQGDLMIPAGRRDAYLPLTYIAPQAGLEVGFDLLSESKRQRNSERALRGGVPMATGRFRLIEDPPDRFSVAVYAPVYDLTMPTSTEAERAAAFIGMGIMLLRLTDLVDRVIAQSDAMTGVGVVLKDTSSADGPDAALLYESRPGLHALSDTSSSEWIINQDLAFADRRWRLIIVSPSDNPDISAPAAAARETFMIGVLFSLLLGGTAIGWRVIARLRGVVLQARSLGQYTLVKPIGGGSMGTVYLAHHALLRRPTAVKVLRHDADDPHLLTRFEREVTLTSRLTHPNTIAIYDFGRTASGDFFYAMELLDGLSLQELVTRHGPQPQGRVVSLLKQALGALAEAHALGLIHRDIKPANVMITRRGLLTDFIKVLDFGLVKDTRLPQGLDITHNAQVIGTPYYLSPEAIQDSARVDHRADLYALAGVAYFLLTGEVVFDAPDLLHVCFKHVHTPPQPPSSRLRSPLSPALDALILSCLAKSPADRPPDALAVLDRLDAITDVPPWTAADARLWWDTFHPTDAHAAQSPQGDPRDLSIDRQGHAD